MILTFKHKQTLLICTAALVIGVTLSALFCSIVVSGSRYVTVTADYGSLSFYDALSRLLSAAYSSSVQFLIVFAAGFTFVPLPIASLVTLWRGVAFGYTLASVTQGRMSFSGDGTISFFGLFGIPTAVIVLGLYFVSSVLLVLFSVSSVTFSDKVRTVCEFRAVPLKRYMLNFCVMFGACAICDVIKSLII